ncbi:MAG: protein arginine kinase [Planctomycetes bacterium]|nr:protein arginine kinase [Planctomycetota bacterium]
MVDFSEILTDSGEWLKGTGPDADVVMSTRVRLARNIQGFPFHLKATPDSKRDLASIVRRKVESSKTLRGLRYVCLEGVEPVDRVVLVERHLISRELADGEGDRGVAIGRKETVSIMVNEEDHLRIQVLRSGFQPEEAAAEVESIERSLEGELPFSFHPKYGYLTACPTNVGTGMRVSAMLHIPALVLAKQVEKFFNALAQMRYAVRGLYGEGTQALGDFFQVSNQVTLGRSEAQIIDELQRVVPEIVKYERDMRQRLMAENRNELEDKIWRSFGLLRHARTLSSEEMLRLLSMVRLGLNLGTPEKPHSVIPGLSIKIVNDLFIATQPAHLQKEAQRPLKPEERDVVRAEVFRKRLARVTDAQ